MPWYYKIDDRCFFKCLKRRQQVRKLPLSFCTRWAQKWMVDLRRGCGCVVQYGFKKMVSHWWNFKSTKVNVLSTIPKALFASFDWARAESTRRKVKPQVQQWVEHVQCHFLCWSTHDTPVAQPRGLSSWWQHAEVYCTTEVMRQDLQNIHSF